VSRFRLSTVTGQRPPISLGEIDVGFEDTPEPMQLVLTNTTSKDLRDITVGLDGAGAVAIQLARDDAEGPGVWAAPGESVLVHPDPLVPSGSVRFWARITPPAGMDIGEREFEFVVNSVAVRSE
jgi:hypothetical protein